MAENRSTSLSYKYCLTLGIAALFIAFADASAKDSLSNEAICLKAKLERDIRLRKRRNAALDSLVSELRKRIDSLEKRFNKADGFMTREDSPYAGLVPFLRGPAGRMGLVGPKGSRGDRGPRGYPGATGARGPGGIMGEKGEQGNVGQKGATGQMGDFGPVGPKGERGDVAQKGEKGATGEAGSPGIKGEKGKSGEYATGSATYVRWGKSFCPSVTGTTQVYSGVAAGQFYNNSGGMSNTLCLHLQPTYEKYSDSIDTLQWIQGVEYEVSSFNPFSKPLHNREAPCSVCRAESRGSQVMIPGRNICPTGWTTEYKGYLMSANHAHEGRSTAVCVDGDAEARDGTHDNKDGSLWFLIQAECRSLPCGPYVNGRELTCAVCTK